MNFINIYLLIARTRVSHELLKSFDRLDIVGIDVKAGVSCDIDASQVSSPVRKKTFN